MSRSRALAGSPAAALAGLALRDARTRTIAFAYAFAIYAYIQPVGFRHAYPTAAQRHQFVHGFAGNDALRLFYGYPYHAITVGGYSAWRVGGTLAIVAAVFGVLAAVRALRSEEDAGRTELVLAGVVERRTALLSALAAAGTGVLVLWAAELAGFVAGGLPTGGAAYLALATASVVPVFTGIGALCSQLAPTRRLALELGSAAVALSLALRVVADTTAGAGWLRWLTPLGWAEELRPFAGARPAALLAPVAASALMLVLVVRLARGRDLATGLLPTRETARARTRLLGSPARQALRAERASIAIWTASVGAFALILGAVSASVSSAGLSANVRREVAKLGSGSIATPRGYMAFVFVFFVLAVSLFACSQMSAAREEEASERLDTLLALPLGRVRWLGARLLVAAAGAALLSLSAALLSWAGAVAEGVHVTFAQMLEAGANCMPVSLLFLGLSALAYAAVPRAGAGIAYGLVTLAFLWQLVGSLLDVPHWLVELTPFAHVGLVPVQPFRAGPAALMVALALLAAAGALLSLRRRDLLGS